MVGLLGQAQSLLTLALTAVWLLSEIEIRLDARSKGSPRVVPRGKDRRSGLGILVALVALFVIVVVYPSDPFWGFWPLWMRALGDLLMVFGITVRVWAVHVLGKFFTPIVTIQGDHKLVEDGPYRVVRHPSYSGALLSIFGFLLAVGGPFALLVGFVLVPLAFGFRIRIEEEALVAGLGEPYVQYMRRTHRLIPWVL